MLTLCWSAKGGSGTTTVAAALSLARPPSLFVDLAGDAAAVLGVRAGDRPGVLDWVASDAPVEHVGDLAIEVIPGTSLIPQPRTTPTGVGVASDRWLELAGWLRDWQRARDGEVIVDCGVGPPRDELLGRATRSLLVTRACYLALTAAQAVGVRPTGVVLVDEPGRSLDKREIERSIGAPVVATVSYAPSVARAVDSGLLAQRLPRGLRSTLADVVGGVGVGVGA